MNNRVGRDRFPVENSEIPKRIYDLKTIITRTVKKTYMYCQTMLVFVLLQRGRLLVRYVVQVRVVFPVVSRRSFPRAGLLVQRFRSLVQPVHHVEVAHLVRARRTAENKKKTICSD